MEGQVAFVTGGAMGIGRAFVDLLISRNVKVCIADVNDTKAKSTIKELTESNKDAQVTFQHCDTSQENQIEEAMKKTIEYFGKIDIIVNNAGISNESKYNDVIAINVNGVISGTMLGLKYLNKKPGSSDGIIINMASLASLLSVPLFPVYTATKHAVLGFTRSIGAISLSKYGVRINCICPSFVDTELVRNITTKAELCIGTKTELDEAMQAYAEETSTMQPEGVAKCLGMILDDATMSGAAIYCSAEYDREILKMPETITEACSFYITKKK